jgi:hypothetical protein
MTCKNRILRSLALIGILAPTVGYADGTVDFRAVEGRPLQSVLTKARIRPGCTGRVRRFLEELHQKPDELLELLKDAGIFVESDFIEETPQGDYLYVFKRLENLEHLKKRIGNSPLPLSQRIREVLVPCVEGRQDFPASTTFLRDE